MLDYREGAKCEAVCGYCKNSVRATLTKVALSLCKGLEEVESVLVDICDDCGNMIAIPARSMLPIQEAAERIIDSELVSKVEEVTVELKSLVNKEKIHDQESVPDYQHGYPLQATG